MKYIIKTTTETEIDVPAYWSSTGKGYFHKLLPTGKVLEVRADETEPQIKLTTVDSGVFCGVVEITEEEFNAQFEIAKQYLGC